MPNTPSTSQRSLTDSELAVLQSLLHINNWKKISKIINVDREIPITAQEAYDALNPTERYSACGKERAFVGFSVGYRFCGPARSCWCAKAAVSQAVKEKKAQDTPEQKAAIQIKRQTTTMERYGVDNVFQRKDVIEDNKKNAYAQQNDVREKRQRTIVERYGVDNLARNQEVKAKMRQTSLDRYGVPNPLSNEVIFAKAKETLHERYGVDNPMHSSEIKAKALETNTSRYGADNPSKAESVKSKIAKNLSSKYQSGVLARIEGRFEIVGDYASAKSRHDFRCVKCDHIFNDTMINGGDPRCPKCEPFGSGLEREIADYVESLGFEVRRNSRQIIKPFELDIVVEDRNVAIEFCGLNWHAEDQLGKMYHLQKLELCESIGYRLITIFEDEWLFHADIVRRRLAHILGVSPKRVFARSCEIRKVSQQDACDFLDHNHSQGKCRSPIRYGLYHQGTIVALMTFGKARFGGGSGYELVRYCSSVSVVGGASRLFRTFVDEYRPNEIMSYADRRWSDGGLYAALGFEEVISTRPNYWYFKNKRREHRLGHTKSKLVSLGYPPDLTEAEIMTARGYRKIYDCGSRKYVWRSV